MGEWQARRRSGSIWRRASSGSSGHSSKANCQRRRLAAARGKLAITSAPVRPDLEASDHR